MLNQTNHNQDLTIYPIIVGARSSPLSKVQVAEVLHELQKHYPSISFDPIFVLSTGDIDQTTSLRAMDKTDFFTKEIDHMLLSGKCRIAIHSAKDLPDPIPEGLELVALTHGVDNADVIVLHPHETLETLRPGAIIATSSERREDAARQLRQDLRFIDLRGTVAQRLTKLDAGEADGVIVAEAALIRLGLTHLNRVRLPGPTAPLQGKLAVLARKNDVEMKSLFALIDSRFVNKILYLGLDLPEHFNHSNSDIIHYPIIQIVPRPHDTPSIKQAFTDLQKYTHFIFTSKSAVKIFAEYLSTYGCKVDDIKGKLIISVGKATEAALNTCHLRADIVSKNETAEGILEELQKMKLKDAYIFWGHSSLSRSIIPDYLKSERIRYSDCVLYDTLPHVPYAFPNLDCVREIVFTSPSTINAFLQIHGKIPNDKKLTAIGPVTLSHLNNSLQELQHIWIDPKILSKDQYSNLQWKYKLKHMDG